MAPGTSFCEFIEYYYYHIEGYADISICSVGVILNVFNIVVFTRKNMVSSANLIFTHLAVADLLFLLTSILYSWIFFFQYMQKDYQKWTYTLAVIYVGSSFLKNSLRFMCVFFTVMLAIWKYIAVAHPLKARYWCTMKITRYAVITCYITSALLSIPMYFSANIVPKYSTTEKLSYYSPSHKKNSIMRDIAFFIKAVLQQLLPSVVLLIFTFRMISALLTKGSNNEPETSCSNIRNNARNARMKQQTDRSIIITLTVVVLFLITQIPLGAINLTEILLPDIYRKLDDLLGLCYSSYVNVISSSTFYYINTSVSFFVYYAMSQNFRTTFQSLFSSGRIIPQKMNVFRLISARKTHTSPEEDQA
ncbi:FMRFamide receptor-like [Planococcus citri]|uniref:FMRFamide receptor-like n=1 Tax=Planococcus citri TaxID=170843 RepID=UPI0031F9CE46